MTEPTHTQEAPAYTRESVMAYLRAAEAERTRLRSAIDDARNRAASARSRIERLDALEAMGSEIRVESPDGGPTASPLDALLGFSDRGPLEDPATADPMDPVAWPGLDPEAVHEGVGDPDGLIEQFRSSLAEDTSTWWPVDPRNGSSS